MKRVATNSFRLVSVVTGVEEILPGDLLCKVKGFDEEGLRRLVEAMRKAESHPDHSAHRELQGRRSVRPPCRCRAYTPDRGQCILKSVVALKEKHSSWV